MLHPGLVPGPGTVLAQDATASPPGGFELLHRVRSTYTQLQGFRDHGSIHIRGGLGTAVAERQLNFELKAGTGGALLWTLRNPEDPDTRRVVVWEDGDRAMVWAGSEVLQEGRAAVAPSLSAALVRSLEGAGADALAVPLLLAGSEASVENVEGAAVEGPEPCGQAASCWRLMLFGQGGRVEAEWWVDTRSLLLHRLNLRLAQEGGQILTVQVQHHPRPGPVPAQELVFRAPPSAQSQMAEGTQEGTATDSEEVTIIASTTPSPQQLEQESAEADGSAAAELPQEDGRFDEFGQLMAAGQEGGQEPASQPGDAAGAGDPWGDLSDEELAQLLAISDVIDVSLLSLSVRITDSRGQPYEDIRPEEVRAFIGRREIPVAAVDWISARSSLPQPRTQSHTQPSESGPPIALDRVEVPPPWGRGRLFVVFVQADFEALRIRGHLRMLPYAAELMESLEPEDWVAVAVFDSHLKVALDFTRDREAVNEVLKRSVRFRGAPVARARRHAPSLVRLFDRSAGLKAATPERALRLVAEAMRGLPGSKDLIYLGWGMGRYGAGGVRMTAEYFPMVRALHAADTTVFALDVTDAAGHSLAVGLASVAAATGGTYASTFEFPGQAITHLSNILTGRHVISLNTSDLGDARGKLRLELVGRKGLIRHAPMRY